ncbi:hypothetical protein IGS68_05035 [Skermanella sp. TT6]|uniref:Uncharacterized protein n=1 Tax=Skermanella cutis TaxID=2775420 RepID=A0ABX7B897_9PROT|nr:hypothetical protein [Skermanella sp. TT6]QQP90610.1 hypothetical protein IGS68_05035 [Skermanella sp. TT6]
MAERDKDGNQPLPALGALQELTLNNTSPPFDDAAACRHLHDLEPELAEADEALVLKLLG